MRIDLTLYINRYLSLSNNYDVLIINIKYAESSLFFGIQTSKLKHI